MPRLTKKQLAFADDYLETGNATLAAQNNYNTSTNEVARSIGSENLTKPNIQEFLQNKAG